MKQDNRLTSTANVILRGSELREIIKTAVERSKRRIHRSIEAQKFGALVGTKEQRTYQQAANEAYDMALRIVNAQFPSPRRGKMNTRRS